MMCGRGGAAINFEVKTETLTRRGTEMYINGKHLRRDGQPFVLMVDESWPVTDLPNLESCDAARAVLEEAIGKIESALAAERAAGTIANNDWLRRARSALRLKKAALQVVAETREKLLLAETFPNR
jgi:hypothetical protein